MEYKPLYQIESQGGSYGWFGIKIEVAAKRLPDLEQDGIRKATYDAVELIKRSLLTSVMANDEQAQLRKISERTELLALFPQPIYVEEIPNGYCSDFCCAHLPWFVVTTHVGRIKIGWRKRVVNIDWSDARDTKTAEELFAVEDVTKGERYIHAWNLEKAGEYVRKILEGSAQ